MNTGKFILELLLNGFVVGATMFIELIKQQPWFIMVVLFAIIMPSRKRKHF